MHQRTELSLQHDVEPEKHEADPPDEKAIVCHQDNQPTAKRRRIQEIWKKHYGGADFFLNLEFLFS
jgi:hypothetical protein